MKVAAVFGASEGLGTSLCETFATRGFRVAAVCRTPDTALGNTPNIRPYACDITDPARLDATITAIEADLGPVDTAIHNAAAFSQGPFLETRLEDFGRAWAVAGRGAFIVAQRVVPGMVERGAGTLLFSGATASRRGSAKFAALAASKFALRGLAQSLAREFGPKGVHVAHVVIDGVLWCSWTRQRFELQRDKCLDPAIVAAAYADLQAQDPSAWSHEIDLRPAGETF